MKYVCKAQFCICAMGNARVTVSTSLGGFGLVLDGGPCFSQIAWSTLCSECGKVVSESILAASACLHTGQRHLFSFLRFERQHLNFRAKRIGINRQISKD